MVRRCAVPNCSSTDLTILSHRFPRNHELAVKWAASLKLQTDLSSLIEKNTICCLHFDESGYRNVQSNHLNVTAIPSLDPRKPRFSQETESSCVAQEGQAIESEEIMVEHEQYRLQTILNDNSSDLISYIEIKTNEDSCDMELAVGNEDYLGVVLSDEDAWETSSRSQDDYDIAPEQGHDEDENAVDNAKYYNLNGEVIEVINLIENNDEIERLDVAIQVDVEELEHSDLEDVEYACMTRRELITALKNSSLTVGELQLKLENYQDAHSQLLQSMDAFKNIMGNLQ